MMIGCERWNTFRVCNASYRAQVQALHRCILETFRKRKCKQIIFERIVTFIAVLDIEWMLILLCIPKSCKSCLNFTCFSTNFHINKSLIFSRKSYFRVKKGIYTFDYDKDNNVISTFYIVFFPLFLLPNTDTPKWLATWRLYKIKT